MIHIHDLFDEDLEIFHVDGREIPKKATTGSACFDLAACLTIDGNPREVHGYDSSNEKIIRVVNSANKIVLYPGDRLLIPTGVIFNMPSADYSVRLYSRSGLSLKKGLVLANGEGIIDYDYTDEVFAIVQNTSSMVSGIEDGERVCQGEMVESLNYSLSKIKNAPGEKTDRSGGFGSTGKV